jgi:hypothetical protein
MQLLTGWDYLHNAFGEGDAFDDDAAREAWGQLRDEIMQEWLRERPLSRPWAWWLYERDIPRPSGASVQRVYLYDHDLLTPVERQLVNADASLLVLKPYGRDW